MLVGLRQAGVPPAGYVTFITAAPVMDPVLFGALILIVGLKAAVVYGTITFGGAMALALAAQRSGIEGLQKPLPADLASTASSACDAPQARGGCGDLARGDEDAGGRELPKRLRADIGASARSAVTLLRSFAALLVVGVLVGLALQVGRRRWSDCRAHDCRGGREYS